MIAKDRLKSQKLKFPSGSNILRRYRNKKRYEKKILIFIVHYILIRFEDHYDTFIVRICKRI